MTPIEKDKLEALCKKWKLSELGISKGIYMADDNTGITMNLRGDVPVVGVTIAGTLHTEGHGNLKVPDLQAEADQIMKSKTIPKSKSPAIEQKGSNPISGGINKAPESRLGTETVKDTKPGNETMKGAIPSESKLGTGDTPAKKGTTTAICQSCNCTITGTIDIFRKIQDEYGVIYCQKCSEDADGKHDTKEEPSKASADQKVAGNVPATPAKPEAKTLKVPMCSDCGIEVPHKEALDCVTNEEKVRCGDCREKHYEKEHQETKDAKDAKAEEHKARPEEPKTPVIRQPDARIPVQAHTPQGSIIKGFQPSLKEIGKIKIGGKGEERAKAGGGTFRLPVKFDHFEIVSLVRDEKGDLIRDPIMDSLGEIPQSLDIMLLFNDPTLNFTSRYNQYQGGKCLCQGDGVTARQVDGAQVECNPDTCPQFTQKKCKPNGILSVILTKSPRLGGVYKFRTTSFYSIRSILSSLFFLSNLTGGVLAMIPLKLTVSPMQVQPKDTAKPQTIFVVNIEFSGTAPELLQKTFDVQKYQSAMRENIIKLESTARAVLTAPESKEEIKDIEAEFYPEKQEAK